MFVQAVLLGALSSTALAGTVLWDGRFNDMTSSADILKWSWSNQVGPYQYYIHGSGDVTEYVNLSPDYKNPADTSSKQGVKITIDSTAKWNSDMWRTELIPQTTAAINKENVWYHFSMKRSDTNRPSIYHEHQVNFFESHFTEMKYGWVNGESGTSNNSLRWFVGGQAKWAVVWDADVWHNCAYEIDFSANSVTFWHSTGSDHLVKTAGPFSASTSSNGADWHLGVLRLPRSGYDSTAAEDWYFSGVYVESGSLTTSVSGPGGSSGGSSSSTGGTTLTTSTRTTSAISTSTKTSATIPSKTTSAASATSTASCASPVAQWGQCGGSGFTGSTCCAHSFKCVKLNDWYSQCQ